MFMSALIEPTPGPSIWTARGFAFGVGNIGTIVSTLLLFLSFVSCARVNAEADLSWSLSNVRFAANFRKIASDNEFRDVAGKIHKWHPPINGSIGNGGQYGSALGGYRW